MRWIFLFLSLFFVTANWANDNDPILKEGKSWKVLVQHWPGEDYYCTYVVQGDTVVGNRQCKKVILSHPFKGEVDVITLAAFEEDNKLYGFSEKGEPALMLDFNLKVGDPLFINDKVLSVDYITIKGIQRRCLKILDGWYWIEGIGTTYGIWLGEISVMIGEERTLIECSDNGKVIFDRDEFFNDVNGINSPCSNQTRQGDNYTIDGIKCPRPSTNKIMIKGNKKFLMK